MYSQWLKMQFDINPDKTKAGLAKALGLEPPAISKILNGTRQVKAQEYAIMRQYFNLVNDGPSVVSSAGNHRGGSVLEPLKSAQGFGEESNAGDGIDGIGNWVLPPDVLSQYTQASPEKVKILQVKEALMEPDFRRGEHVLVDLSSRVPSPPGVFIVSDGFGYLIRRCEMVPQSHPPQVKVAAKEESFLPQTLDMDEFEIIGRVIAKLQWV